MFENDSVDPSKLVEIREFYDGEGRSQGSEIINLAQQVDMLQQQLNMKRQMSSSSADDDDGESQSKISKADLEKGQEMIDKLRENLQYNFHPIITDNVTNVFL